MSGDDYQWLLPTLAIALFAAIVSHTRRRYGQACLITSVVSGLALMALYTVSARREITLNNFGQFIAWVPMLFLPGFLCGLCVSPLVGVVFLLGRRVRSGLRTIPTAKITAMKNDFFQWWDHWYAYPTLFFVLNFLATAIAEISLSLSRRSSVSVIATLGAGLLGGMFGGSGGLLGVGLFALWQRGKFRIADDSDSANATRQENGIS